MNVRTTYDNKGRLLSKVSTDKGESVKYTYHYNGDSEKPNHINRTMGKISQLVYQEDSQGRTIYDMNIEENAYMKIRYGVEYKDLVEEFSGLFDFASPDINSHFEKVEIVYDNTDNLIMIGLLSSADLEITYEFLHNLYDKAELDYDSFVEIPDTVRVNRRNIILKIENDSIVEEMKMYLQDMNIIYSETYDRTTDCSMELTSRFEQYVVSDGIRAEKVVSGIKHTGSKFTTYDSSFIARETRLDQEELDTTYMRSIMWSGDKKPIKSSKDVEMEKKGDQIIYIEKFADNTIPENNYTIEKTLDEEGRLYHVYNGLRNSDITYEYNDQGLLVKMEVVGKAAPKKILYKGTGNQNIQPPQTFTQKWHYDDEGHLLMHTRYQPLACDFEVYEYDDQGREIFFAEFSTLAY